MAFRKILVGTDGSATADVARDAAIKLARVSKATLLIASAYEETAGRAAAEAVTEAAVRAASGQGVEAEAEVRRGEPADVVLELASYHDADLLVVGNKGMGAASRFRLGSVPDRVAHYAPCDLLIVDTSRAPGQGAVGEYRSILAATDGSPTATEAARKALELAALTGAVVILVYVCDPLIGAIRLEETARLRPEGVEVRPLIVQGDPAEQICSIAEREGSDLVVVGNKGMAGPRRFLLGSVPNKVSHYAPTDVLIVKTIDRTLAQIEPGQGAVVDLDGRRVAVYRDREGRLFMLSPRCTHMGCVVGWNAAEATWDCPCHGSRYSFDGKVIRGPATRGLDGSEAPAPREGGPGRRRDERFVIVGASLGGGTAAATLREEGFEGKLVLIGAEGHFPYERPPLSKAFLRGEVAFEEALVRPVEFYRDHDVETRFSTRVTAVDIGDRHVVLAGGERVAFDRLLIATGARNRRFPIPGLDLAGVYDLRTVGDAERIRAEIAPGRRVVVAGLGFIGSEVAASLRQRGLEVVGVDGLRVPLERVLGEQVGGVLEGIHRDNGVRLIFQDRVAAFEGTRRVERVVTTGGVTIDCDFAVIGLGVEPVTDFLEGSGIEIDNGILVDEFCRTNVEGVYAAGDVANYHHPVFGRRIRVEHWQNAMRHGRAAALVMMGTERAYRDVPWFWSDQYEHNLQYTGHHTDWDELVVRGSLEDRSFAAFYLKEGRLQAMVVLNRGDEVAGARTLIERGGSVDALRLRDEEVDLAALA